MSFEPDPEPDSASLQQVDTYLRDNPIPALLGALAVGFAIGLIARALEPRPRAARPREILEDAEDYLHSVWSPFAKKTRHAYNKSASAVRDVMEDTVERVRGVDVEEYTDPVEKWFRKLWKSCCG